MVSALTAIFMNTLIGAAGMMSVAWWNAMSSPNTGKPSLVIFWRKNKDPFIFSMITILGATTLLIIIPDVSQLIDTIFGITLSATSKNGSAFILGALVYDNIRKKFKIKGEINIGQQT